MEQSNRDSLFEYEQLVVDQFDSNSEEFFSNGEYKHARIVMKNIFLNSQKTVRLITDKLPMSCTDYSGEEISVYEWEELVEAAVSFLKKPGAKLSVITRESENINLNHPLLKGIFKSGCDSENKVHIKMMSSESGNCKGLNFMVGDEKSIRFEKNGKSVKALACANSPKNAFFLNKMFDDDFENSSLLKIA